MNPIIPPLMGDRPAAGPALGHVSQPAKRKKPHVERIGNVSVPIYATRWRDKRRRRVYKKFAIIWTDGVGRHREQHSSWDVAVRRAREVANALVNGEISMEQLTQEDRAAHLYWQQLAARAGRSVTDILSDAVRAYEVPGGAPTLEEAQRYWADHHPAGATPKTCPEILVEMLAKRKKTGSSKNTLDDWRSRLGRFTEDFPVPILSLTAKDLDNWLDKLDCSRRTRNNYRGNLVDFYRFARQAGYCPKTWTPLDDVERAKEEPIHIEVFTPADFVRIITRRESLELKMAARGRRYKSLVPYLAIGAFAGCRHEEMCAPGRPVLDWRQVDLVRKRIQVLQEVARKIGRDRIVPMSDNLVAWLTPYARKSGPICELANANNAFQRAAKDAKLKWKRNGLRRSFISYRLALVKDMAQVALEAGTSEERILKNYKATRDEEEGHAWFNIQPTRADVLPLFAWAKRGGN